jgi:peptidoglycan/LPS O-acetylase OafA/YrhL
MSSESISVISALNLARLQAKPEFSTAAHGLRGLAAAGVFMGHITGGLRLHVYQDNPDFVHWSGYAANLGTYGVELFFVISGYVIAASALRYEIRDFFARRIVRIYPVFLFFTLLFAAGNAVLNIVPEKNSIQSVFANLVFLDLFSAAQPNQGGLTPNAWSITFEMWFYLFTGFAAYFLRRSNHATFAAVISCFALFIYFFPISAYFVSGLICFGLRQGTRASFGRFLHLVEFGALAVVLFIASQYHFVYIDGDFARPEVLALFAATCLLFYAVTEKASLLGRGLSARPFRFLGTISYSLYLSHPYVYFVLRAALGAAGLLSLPMLLAAPLFFAVMAIGGIIAAYLVNITLERAPYEYVFHTKVYHAETLQNKPA